MSRILGFVDAVDLLGDRWAECFREDISAPHYMSADQDAFIMVELVEESDGWQAP